ncbi:penicillin-binding protein 1A [Thiocapsa roseopersicina]|uniref:Penicillin-binding protein 1A n=1 Tax=Thiocapsa roseopersicina TaxID=1058 RepID=A0A1H3BR32_THIRO|nr:PBP1A family penicillin-binding protein [Thiocapsa roseopersicina]SDX44297.1 penicillin-binding protein 1A [Thiocapsa roseopersicina]
MTALLRSRRPERSVRSGRFAGRVGTVVGLLLSLPLLALLALVVFLAVTLHDLERSDLLADIRLHEPLRIYSADGLLMGEFGIERRESVPIERIPLLLIDAFLAAEDSRFFAHEGLDVAGLARAVLAYLRTGEPRQGGSTISMQVARNLFLTSEKTFDRKFAEILLAWHLERTLSKDEILALYLNKIFFGHRAYGVAAAGALYYAKTLDELTLAEAAMLAGIPKAPSTNNPVSDPQRARIRRDYVLGRMLELGQIDAAAYREAHDAPDSARLHGRELELDAGYAAEMARREMVGRYGEEAYRAGYRVTTSIGSEAQLAAQEAVRRALLAYDQRHGYRGPESRVDLARRGAAEGAKALSDADLDRVLDGADRMAGLTVGIAVGVQRDLAEVYIGRGQRVTLSRDAVRWARPLRDADRRGPVPRAMSDVLSVGDLVRLTQDALGRWTLAQRPAVSGALVSVSPLDGAILAIVGGYAFAESQFNRAVDARRPAGSTFKPFIYAAALHAGWTPASLARDEPVSRSVRGSQGWRPRNFDGKNLGPIRLRPALVQSRNLAAIDLLDQVGVDEAIHFVARFGLDPAAMPRGLSLALGTAEVSPLQMAGAYAVFANGGYRIEPYLIRRIENAEGDPVFEAAPRRACEECWYRGEPGRSGVSDTAPASGRAAERVLRAPHAYQMHSMLQDVVRVGTGARARELGRDDIAGKTGTTDQVRDSWFCGYQKDLATVAWMGFDDFSPLGSGETGGQAAIGMWMDFMGQVLAGRPEAIPDAPSGMVQVRVDRASGALASSSDSDVVLEWLHEDQIGLLPEPSPWEGIEIDGVQRIGVPSVIEQVY